MKRFFANKKVTHKVTRLNMDRIVKKKSHVLSDAQKLAKSIAMEVSGLQPYEKKAVEYIKSDNIKKARKFLKVRLGSLKRGEKKVDVLMKYARQ